MFRFALFFLSFAFLSSLALADIDTTCSASIFANALKESAESGAITEDAHESEMQAWIYSVLENKENLQNVLNCPEFTSVDDDDAVTIMPIQYVFPNGREIVINYETTPTVLNQKILLSEKQDLPSGPHSADLTDGDAIWTNVDPAWYAIMVVEHGALDEFVGSDKNNTISMKYIDEHIDDLYPRDHNGTCTSKSALADNKASINESVKITVGIGDEDTNDYYVAGDRNLGWIMYAEIALDVVITVVTMGGGTVLAGVVKGTRAMKNIRGLRQTMHALIDGNKKVADFVKIQNKVYKSTNRLNDIKKAIATGERIPTPQELKKIADAERNLKRAQEARQAAARANKGAKEMEQLYSKQKTAQQELNRLRKTTGGKATPDDIKKLEQESKELTEQLKSLDEDLVKARKADKTGDIRKYEEASQQLDDTIKYADTLRGTRALLGAKRGNVVTRLFKTFKGLNAAMHGEKTLNRGARIARSSMKSGRIKDWLFHSTMKNLGRLGKIEAQAGVLYTALEIGLNMYDYTETSTGDFTNNIEFKPLLLLSADDIDGQENVINYGMWLLWAGDSISPNDDDAAYLQAMDFAAKFYQDLSEHQNETNSPCNVDIFVVRPIIRNPGDINQELYYLIMNDEPWSTAHEQ